MFSFKHRAFAFVPLLAASASAHAQGVFTISNSGVAFTLNALGTSTSDGPNANFSMNSVDHLVQNCWWYGVGLNRTREFTFAAADVTSAGTTGPGSFQQTFDIGSLTFRIDYRVQAVGSNGGMLTQTVTVTNNGFQAATVDLFNYVDPSIQGTNGGDTATSPGYPDTVEIQDIATQQLARLYGPAHMEARGGTTPAVRSLLTDADLDVFTGTGLPYLGSDCSVGYQWRFTGIPRGRSRSCTVVFAVNTPQPLVSAGACRLQDDTCTFTTEHDCLIRGATFLGNGTHCPNPTCPCDLNESGALNSQDFFDFLVDFFLGIADYNFDGLYNSQDFFDFMTCFFTAPNTCIP